MAVTSINARDPAKAIGAQATDQFSSGFTVPICDAGLILIARRDFN